MKKLFSPNNKKNLLLWLAFTASILLSFALSLVFSPNIKFSTSLFDILPPSSDLSEVQDADTIFAERTGRTLTLLVQNADFDKAKRDAEKLYSFYTSQDSGKDFFDELSLYVSDESVDEVTRWISDWKFNLLDSESTELLENGGEEMFQEDSLGRIFGAFNIADLSLISEKELTGFLGSGALSATSMSPKDGVLACFKDGKWFVLIRGTISQSGASLLNKKSTVKSLYRECAAIQSDSDSEFIFSGVPFHSYDNSSSAQFQISLISTVSLILIVAAFFLIFRSLFPALVSALAVVFSCSMGFVSVLLFFRSIHVLTFVFGTTLIGTCLDYSIHFFINWKFNSALKDGADVRNHIFKGVGLGFLSTEICFACLFVSPFPLLKQVGLFLFTGLAASFLSVICLYPLFNLPADRKELLFKEKIGFIDAKFRKTKKIIPVVLAVLSFAVIFEKRGELKIYNNISTLYSMTPKMLENEKISASVLNTGSSGWYFILRAASEEELLRKNENLDKMLDSAIQDERLETYLSVTQFVPSAATQKKSYDSLKKLVPLVDSQYELLGFPEDFASAYKKSFEESENRFFGMDDLPQSLKAAVKSIYIGNVDGEFYTCVMPLHVRGDQSEFFREFAAKTDGVYFVNKVTDISAQLDLLSKNMLKLLLVAFIIIVGMLFLLYKPAIVVKIAFVPCLVSLVSVAALLLAKIPLSFFPIASLILVFGLGLDYIIYEVEGAKSKERAALNDFAIYLSFVTTALSFGALALSSFPPVHMLGLTVFVGLVTAVLGALTIIEK